MPHLSRPQAKGLALWSFGIAVAQQIGLTRVSVLLAEVTGCQEATMRERLRDWYRDAAAKSGRQRRDLDVVACFPALLRWVVDGWPADSRRLALVLDATTLGDHFTVLAISVVVRGCAVPVAWRILPGNRKAAWRPHWEALLKKLSGVLPTDWTVLVLADRGLYAPWLFASIVEHGWHPILRINQQGQFRLAGDTAYRPLSDVVATPDSQWSGCVVCFKSRPLACTLLAYHSQRHADRWLVVTDLAPAEADAAWYSLRPWIECGFKDFKRGGWQWQSSRQTDPARAERRWLAMAVASLWVIGLGQVEQDAPPAEVGSSTPAVRSRAGSPSLSCFTRGVLVLLARLIRGEPVPFVTLRPEAWPVLNPAVPFASLPDLPP
jgi:hypothetical protein